MNETEQRPSAPTPTGPPSGADQVFGSRLELAVRFHDLLAQRGVELGLIGPREVDRLWDRHLMNSAVISDLFPEGARVVDVGSGAGLPGIPLAIVRPDLRLTLLEPMARRVGWLEDVTDDLGLSSVTVVRGRAEEKAVRTAHGGADVVTARAVAPLAKLAAWCLPLARTGGLLVALKGASAAEEIERDAREVKAAGGGDPEVVTRGDGVLEVPTTVVLVPRVEVDRGRDARRRRRKDR
ncbi:16S rRNA (guanine(527)-N(7))-methyltransferase RsmG [Allokutzneria sp. A3M-2-11 16]|uniref:16S rRNA (guanine(527)-N(7))-methyltransferase RsmG n=1 Tax=Allokutzneria sp. A3M-2-11 16 TaxID=2962043 RepID=UPI0020B7D6D7|nr:16S rRNA (guanine(527)-N(7))-methyltransferase RsmG [Allokutzneria sp. A3M-2-11 16]MCP3799502.1 16S rRNA (guanine(527)-N(7))-methyltransferase RsmG [Allokutzneria sp. A3M-2-11 16]